MILSTAMVEGAAAPGTTPREEDGMSDDVEEEEEEETLISAPEVVAVEGETTAEGAEVASVMMPTSAAAEVPTTGVGATSSLALSDEGRSTERRRRTARRPKRERNKRMRAAAPCRTRWFTDAVREEAACTRSKRTGRTAVNTSGCSIQCRSGSHTHCNQRVGPRGSTATIVP